MKHCPDAFAILSDTGNYEYEKRAFTTPGGKEVKEDLLYVGYYAFANNSKSGQSSFAICTNILHSQGEQGLRTSQSLGNACPILAPARRERTLGAPSKDLNGPMSACLNHLT